MNQKNSNPGDISFQIAIGHLTLSSPLPKQDIHVTVCVDNVSKITCPGNLSADGLTVTWNHPFLFSSTPSDTVRVSICTLPEKVTSEWDKQLLGDQVITTIANLLQSSDGQQYGVSGLSTGLATISMTCMPSDVLIVSNGHNCLSVLRNYSRRLYDFARKFKNVACVSAKIELELAQLDFCPLGHADHTSILNNLSGSFSSRYIQEGDIADLNRAIEVGQTRLDLCPLGHPEHTKALGELAIDLWNHYCIQENKEDLDKLIAIQERWLELCPSDHPDHGRALSGLSLSLSKRYDIHRDMVDLNRAIEMREKRLDICPTDSLSYEVALGNLAVSLSKRYKRYGNISDLDRVISLEEKRLGLCPSNHHSYRSAHQNLALSLQDHYIKMQNPSDLIRAIKLLKQALASCPIQHYQFPLVLDTLCDVIFFSCRSLDNSNEPLPSPNDAFQIYKQLKGCSPAVSLDLLKAIQSWVKSAEEHNHPSVLEAYQTLLNTLDHFTSFNSSLESRHEIMQARVANAANDAFSCVSRQGDLKMAAEFLEQGRGILWNQLARFDVSITALEALGSRECELGRKFTKLSGDLKKLAQRSGQSKEYWRVHGEWQSVVAKIRRLDGFSRFLLPPCFDDLQRAAEYGPVIIVNASEYSCDGLIVLRDRPPIHVNLCGSLDDVIQLCSDLSELTRDAHAYGPNREFYVMQMLRVLWAIAVRPVVTVLQNDVQLAPGSRIWWCPTSKFVSLPFHAAGPYRRGMKNLMDLYISSYAPSLSALIRARDRLRSSRGTPQVSSTLNQITFAAVGQARPGADAKLPELPEVEHEIDRIRNETGMPSNVKFETVTGDAASIEGAVRAFRDHRWVHIACHGAQHATKPFESWFAMRDGRLTLMRIIQERYSNSEFAFLSACHTAVGDDSTPDEVLHLAAGMQFAGFNGVIGTLWRVDDAIAHDVVTRFYREMFQREVLDFEYAATALNIAARETADKVSLEKRIVFVHIGI